MTDTMYENIPVVALRGLVILPGELLHFDAGRDKSLNALNAAIKRDDLVFLSAQKDARKVDIVTEDIFKTGMLCRLKQILSLPGDNNRVFVEGICRATALSFTDQEDYIIADTVSYTHLDVYKRQAIALCQCFLRLFYTFCCCAAWRHGPLRPP